jgi:predicted transcriptional regulator
MKKGDLFEKIYSVNIFKNEYPFLISSKLLRENNLGQIDFSKVTIIQNKTFYEIVELKYQYYPGFKQLKRLKQSQEYLSRILESEVKLSIRLCQKRNDSLFY